MMEDFGMPPGHQFKMTCRERRKKIKLEELPSFYSKPHQHRQSLLPQLKTPSVSVRQKKIKERNMTKLQATRFFQPDSLQD